jgi:hypothetical protein
MSRQVASAVIGEASLTVVGVRWGFASEGLRGGEAGHGARDVRSAVSPGCTTSSMTCLVRVSYRPRAKVRKAVARDTATDLLSMMRQLILTHYVGVVDTDVLFDEVVRKTEGSDPSTLTDGALLQSAVWVGSRHVYDEMYQAESSGSAPKQGFTDKFDKMSKQVLIRGLNIPAKRYRQTFEEYCECRPSADRVAHRVSCRCWPKARARRSAGDRWRARESC